jgi:hypothetical protein
LALKKVTPLALQDQPLAESPTLRRADFSDAASSRIEQRGQAFFGAVYGKVAERVMTQLDNSGTEDLGLVARLMYSHILSNTSVLNAVDTSFVMIAALVPQDVSFIASSTKAILLTPVGKRAVERPPQGGFERWSNFRASARCEGVSNKDL